MTSQSDSMAAGWLHAVLYSCALAGAVIGWPAPARGQAATERASLGPAAAQALLDSDTVSISGNGRFVAFRSFATNLVSGDTNGVSDVFVRDRWTGAIERVSVSSTGEEADAESLEPSLSYDGRYVVFASEASNLVTDVPPGSSKDIFLRDRLLGTTRIVTVSATGGASSGDSHRPRVSSDGRYVSFEGSAANLVAGTTTSGFQVFRRDLQAGTVLVSVSMTGTSPSGFSWNGAISGDGRYVAFVSSAATLVSGDTNGLVDCFRRDLQSGTTRRISVSTSGAQADGTTFTLCSMSRDGRWVAFSSSATNLAPGEFGAGFDIFLYDVQASVQHRVSLTSAGLAANGNSYDPAVSDDGRFVAFASYSTNLDPLDTDTQGDVFLRDRTLGTTRLVSRGSSAGADDDSFLPAISADGAQVAFHSESTDLVPQDTNLRIDAFVRDTGTDNHATFCAGLATTCPCGNAGQGGAGCENSASLGGALLRAFGQASVASDSVTLLATGLPAATSAVFFQGTARENGGNGTIFGDGLRCAGGTIVRLSQYPVVAGVAATGFGGAQGLNGGSTVPVHVQGLVTAGGTRTYQIWYRNSAAFCTGAVFNLSNGVEIAWTM